MDDLYRLEHGDCIALAAALDPHSIDAVVTSPPYAQQRKNLYGGIDEADYPPWTVRWMEPLKTALKPSGSVAIVIRPHVHQGVLSDYMLHTRLALRAAGWIELEEMIWSKPDSPPLGVVNRPRRAWESIHWFGLSSQVYCDPKANGNHSDRVGMQSSKGVGSYISGADYVASGIARCRDVVEVGTSAVDRSSFNTHPAQYPTPLAEWLVKLLAPKGGMVLDPFAGSGTTLVAALLNRRRAIGFDVSEEYLQIAAKRLQDTVPAASTFERYFPM